MAEKEIKISFPEAKMEALEFFLGENNTTVADALKEQLDKIYEKNVPQQVKKFVEREVTPRQEQTAQEERVQERPARRGRPDAATDRLRKEKMFRNSIIQTRRLWKMNSYRKPGRSLA